MINYNGLKSEIKKSFESDYYYVTPSKYINIPILVGFSYITKTDDDDVALFLSLGVGPDFLKVTDLTRDYSYGSSTVYSFDFSTQLAYKLGGGFIVKDKVLISLFYNGLGNHIVEGEINTGAVIEPDDVKVQLFTLTLGFKL